MGKKTCLMDRKRGVHILVIKISHVFHMQNKAHVRHEAVPQFNKSWTLKGP